MSNQYRHEFKYLISNLQIQIIRDRLKYLMPIDSHAQNEGFYNIRSLYFDDYYNRCYFENIAGSDPREKFRIRIYNASSSRITLECKRKERGKTMKTSCPLSMQQYEALAQGRILSDIDHQPGLLRKFMIEMITHGLKPAIIVGYDRIPYVYDLGNVRVTLDMNLFSSNNLDDFLKKDIQKRPVMPVGMHLMEVKWDEFIPDQIYRACQLDNLRQTAYSKYVLCRKYSI